MKVTALCLAPLVGSILGVIALSIIENQFENARIDESLGIIAFTYILALIIQLTIELVFFLLTSWLQFRLKEYCLAGFYATIGFCCLSYREFEMKSLVYLFIAYTLGNILTYYFLYFRHLPEIKETNERK